MATQNTRNPAVPRAPRAKPRANSVGVLAREMRKEGSQNSSITSNLSRTSENRRPTGESPFSHARVNLLQREKTSVDNQVFEMGPKARASSVDRREVGDFNKGQFLAKENAVNQGMPWCQPTMADESEKPKGRRHVLRNEHLDADQELEWVPKEVEEARFRPQGENQIDNRSHARVNIYAREVTGAAQAFEMAPMVQVPGFTTAAANVGGKDHGRRNVIHREAAKESQSAEGPIAQGYNEEGVPTYGRKVLLMPHGPREPRAPLEAR